MLPVWILLLLLLVAASPSATLQEVFTVGYLTGSQRRPGDLEYPRPGLTISGAISLAVEEVNLGRLGNMGHKLEFIVAETYGEEVTSVQRTAELWTRNVSAYIGPQETCEHEAFMAAAFNLPMISYFCTHHSTSDKAKFPTFARTRPPNPQISKSVASVLLSFNWKHVVLLYLDSPGFEFSNIASVLLQTLDDAGIAVVDIKTWESPYHHGYTDNPFYGLVEETYRDTRIYVVVGHHYDHLGLLVAMEDKKLFDKGEYWVVGVDIEQYDNENPGKYLRGLLRDDLDPRAVRAYRNYLGVVPSSPVGFENFTLLVNSYMERPPFNYPNPLTYIGGTKRIRAEAAYLYDAVHLYANALVKILESGGNPRNGTAIVDMLKKTHYSSAMGYIVYMDENGDAEGNYTLVARKPLTLGEGEENKYGLFPVGLFALRNTQSNIPVLYITDTIDWVTGNPPLSSPPCGFKGEKCITYTMEITGGIVGGAVFVFLIILMVLYRNWRYEQELDSLLWKIDFREIQINDQQDQANGSAGGFKTSRPVHPLMRTSQVSLVSSNPDADFRYSTVYNQIGLYKGRIFAIKKVNKRQVDITREMKKELKMMRDLRHDNLNSFIGACTDPPNICIITEYCSRGSLRDILENEDVKLDNMFIASLVGDILRGMIYLHESPVKFHGSLHTGNCLIDSRWVVKVADFGLREFMAGAIEETLDLVKPADRRLKLLYRAPELLRSQEVHPGTQKGDVYSFGIILYEINGRNGPFGETSLSPPELLHRLANLAPGGVPFRPPLEALESTFDFVKECLKECWSESPDDRPEFKAIRTKLRPLRKGMKSNIFDNMMAMMEKYANNLEVLVDERTDQLQEEKKKTEALLYEMLPRPVAEQLKRGNKVEAEGFDCVTIYFSDIVGFTEMSAESTPLQVVDFLNDLYTCFDSIIEHYDVYKVETIGDAYMVVSGLPIRNNDHAAEIASMSLHLLSEVKLFTIRHRPAEKLKLRIGIHSGPVCAGVVGLKMPRYCLFGDTVNTASRMESTGQPLRIHCSQESKNLLINLGGYQLVERGVVALKGKGDQLTYWLIGEDADHRRRRQRERLQRRGLAYMDTRIGITRSSLKTKTPLTRCSSLESPKRLRFASEETPVEMSLEVIADASPSRKVSTELLTSDSSNGDTFRTSSSSCPCIENLTNSVTTLAHSQLVMLGTRIGKRQPKESCCSVPTVFLPKPGKCPVIHTISAPVSPNKRADLVLAKCPECEEVLSWMKDSTPLLRVRQPQEARTCI